MRRVDQVAGIVIGIIILLMAHEQVDSGGEGIVRLRLMVFQRLSRTAKGNENDYFVYECAEIGGIVAH